LELAGECVREVCRQGGDVVTAVTTAEAIALIRKAKRTVLEDRLLADLAKLGLPVPEREYRFHPVRKWRFDLAYPSRFIAIECDGGTWSGGRHVRGAGYQRDAEKFNAASRLGWAVFHYTGAMIRSGEAAREIAEALGGAA